MVMSLINQKLSEGKLYRKVVEHLRKCDYTLDEFFNAIDFIIRMLEDDALQRGDKLEPDKRIDVSVRAKSKPVQNNSFPFCNEQHPPHGCRRVTDVAARRRILLRKGICFNCINSGHRSDKCPVPNSCNNCSGNHNTAICDDYNPRKQLPSVPSTSARSNSSSDYSISQSTTSRPVVNATPQQHETGPCPSKDKVESKQCKSAKVTQMSSVDLPCTILLTAMAKINHKPGSERVRLFLDTGSQRSFISVKIARQLGPPVVGKVALNIAPFGSTEISGQYDVVSCRVEIGRRVVRMKLVAHENVDVPIHNASYVQVRQHLLSKGVTLADPENKSDKLKNVHILVGADYFSYFIIGIEKVDGISLFLTHNGMSPYGKVLQWLLEGQKIEHVKTLRVCRIAGEPNQFDVDEWWHLDRVGIAPSEQYTVRKAETMRKVSQSVVKKPEGYQSFYIDNYLSTFENAESMRQEQESVNKILERAGMPLEGWASNNLAFDSEKQWSEPVNVNVLELRWARDVDRLCVKESLISPLFVRGKLFLQQLWEDNVGWDDMLRREKAREAGELLCELKAVSNITFPRAVGNKNLELHVFTNASSKAYGAVAYIRDNCNQVRLLTSKMKITPKGMNKLTIPKLELLALLLGCKLAKTLKGLIEPREIVMWTDSKVTMAWVASPDAKENKNIFISNRVAEIIFLRQVCDFSLSYVPSKQNPADVLSRGATTQQLLQNPLWQKGTEFLGTTGEPVPYKEDDPTSVRAVVAAVQELREEIRPVPLGEIWELLQREVEFQFSLRVTRLILRFAKLKRDPFRIVVQLEQKYLFAYSLRLLGG
ncbi:uncharacterized protein [Palaemon carinicauda]|uniref:uncharacterized protein n=1 Tax=Palaemon carinicauda TaxID=392227 RepID=UPI0035B659A3